MAQVAHEWGEARPIVLIAEGRGGCNATAEFYDHFRVEQEITIPQWPGLHDYVQIGHWTEEVEP